MTPGNDLSFRPDQPAYRGQSWALATERSSHVRGLCPWCCRAGGSPCRSRADARRGPPCPVARAPRAGCCPAGSVGCLPPPRVRGGRTRSSSPGGVPGDLAGCAAGISRRPGTPARCLAARAWRRPHPPLVRAPCPSWCPRPGPGGMRYLARHPTAARLPAPGPPGAGMMPAQPSPAPSPPWPGSDGAAPGVPGTVGTAWRDWHWPGCQCPLRAAVSPHRPSEPRPDFFDSWPSSWSPVTESNRRPSPYHGQPDHLPTSTYLTIYLI